MNTSKALRFGGFTVAVGLTASLIGFAAQGTGAYFTDTHDGTINVGTGQVKVSISPSDGQLNFTNLLPGEYQTNNVAYTSLASSNAGEDVWLVFPTGTGGTTGPTGTNTDGTLNPSEQFTGNGDDGVTSLGQYGHFEVSVNSGSALFTSYNLANPGTTSSHQGPVCYTDANGYGGSTAQPASPTAPPVPYCAPPTQILLSSGLTYGQSATANLTFGFTPKLHGGQNGTLTPLVQYQIVATQHGILPNNPFNPANP